MKLENRFGLDEVNRTDVIFRTNYIIYFNPYIKEPDITKDQVSPVKGATIF